MELIYAEHNDANRYYLEWQEDAKTLTHLLIDSLLPIYENALFILVYKSCYQKSYSTQSILKAMKKKILKYIKTLYRNRYTQELKYGLFKENGGIKYIDYSAEIYKKHKETSEDKAARKNKAYNKYEANRVTWKDLYNKITWSENKTDYAFLQKFVQDFFKKTYDYQTNNPDAYTYNINYNTFSLIVPKAIYKNDHTRIHTSENHAFRDFHGKVVCNILKYKLITSEQIDFQK